MIVSDKKNWFAYTAESWIASLKMLFSQEFKLFSLLAMNSLVQAWKIVFEKFWWLLLYLAVAQAHSIFFLGHSLFAELLLTIAQLLIVFILYLAVRPSVEAKDYFYFWRYKYHCLSFILGFFLFITATAFSFGVLSVYTTQLILFIMSLFPLLGPALQGVLIFTLFFFFDSPLSFKGLVRSFLNGIKLTWYSLPFTLLIICTFNFIEYAIKELVFMMVGQEQSLLKIVNYSTYLFFFSFLLSIFSIFYNRFSVRVVIR